MTVTDTEQLVRVAIATILTADTTLQSVCGRTTLLAVERAAFSIDSPLPVAVVEVLAADYGTGRLSVQIDGVGNGPTAGADARAVCEAATNALTWSAFSALGLDIVPAPAEREFISPDDPIHLTVLRDGDPTLHQARATVALLSVE